MRFIIILLISIYMYTSAVQGQAVLIEQNGRSLNRSRSQVSSTVRNAGDFRNQRKVGIGMSAAGAQGLAGVTLELNFTPETSFLTSFGLGDRFQTFGVSIKRNISGKYFSPYIAGGFTRWYTVTDEGPIDVSQPSFLAERFLNSNELAEGQFAETLIYPALGIQYLQLDGAWAGSSLFIEVMMLLDIDEFKSAPAGSLGYMFYF